MRSVVQGVFLVLLSVSTTRLRKRGIDVLLKWQLTVYCVWEIVPGRLPSIYLSRCGFILFFRTKRTLMGCSHGASVFWWIAMGNLTFVYNLKCGLLLHKDFPFSAQPPALLTKTSTNLIVLLFCTIETAEKKKTLCGGFFSSYFLTFPCVQCLSWLSELWSSPCWEHKYPKVKSHSVNLLDGKIKACFGTVAVILK